MTAAEVMLSESQERMIVIARKEHEADVLDHFRRWEIACRRHRPRLLRWLRFRLVWSPFRLRVVWSPLSACGEGVRG